MNVLGFMLIVQFSSTLGGRFRVKRLCTSPVAPSLLWSAGEDGTVRVIDLREAHTCGATSVCNNICINLNGENISNGNQLAEAKCLDICPTNPYIAVGSSDQFVRLFDIRKLRLCSENFLYTFGACRLVLQLDIKLLGRTNVLAHSLLSNGFFVDSYTFRRKSIIPA